MNSSLNPSEQDSIFFFTETENERKKSIMTDSSEDESDHSIERHPDLKVKEEPIVFEEFSEISKMNYKNLIASITRESFNQSLLQNCLIGTFPYKDEADEAEKVEDVNEENEREVSDKSGAKETKQAKDTIIHDMDGNGSTDREFEAREHNSDSGNDSF